MNGDRAGPSGGTRTSPCPRPTGPRRSTTRTSSPAWSGSRIVYNGVDTKPVSKTVNVPWRSPADGQPHHQRRHGRPPGTSTPRPPTRRPRWAWTAAGGWRTTSDHTRFDDDVRHGRLVAGRRRRRQDRRRAVRHVHLQPQHRQEPHRHGQPDHHHGPALRHRRRPRVDDVITDDAHLLRRRDQPDHRAHRSAR